jgi:hypothetical protein
MLIKPIDLDDKAYFINIPNKLRRVTSLIFSKGLTNNNQFKVTSIDYLFNINQFSSLKTIQTVSLYY